MDEPLLFKVPTLNREIVRIENWNLSGFYDPVHFHEEFQITYILEGKGTLYVGNSIDTFKSGDLFLFGKNLPHVIRNDRSYYNGDQKKHARAISIFFNQDDINKYIADIPGSAAIRRLIDYSLHGVRVTGNTAYKVFKIMGFLNKTEGFEKYIGLLMMLDDISKDSNLEFISSGGVQIKRVTEDLTNINRVFDYVRTHFQERITLQEIAELVCMSPTTFCRFFKSKTLKTFSRFLVEVRIGNARKLLIENDLNSTECCYACGFNNISNFHRHFRSITGMTPGEYKRRIKTMNVINVS